MSTLLLGLILTVYFGLRVTDGQALVFVLNGRDYTSGSTVLRSDIGEGPAALQCTTDSTTCCTSQNGETHAGEFYFPDGSMVVRSGVAASNSYYRTRSSMLISLNHQPTAMETGWFRCEIPDDNGTLVNLCINIVDELPNNSASVNISIYITTSGTNTAGETYSLECFASVTGSTDQPTINWLDPMTNPVLSEMVTTTCSMSTQTFNPLAASHAGTYTCRVTAGGVTETQTSTVIVNVITAQMTRSSSGPLTAGQTDFFLSCNVTGTENLNAPSFTYQWLKNGGVIFGQQGSTLSHSPLTASNAGEYNCSVTVSSTSLSSTVTVNSNNTEIVLIQLPPPTSVNVTSDQPNPIRPVGSTVTLTCTVVLAENVDGLTVNTEWTGPNRFSENRTAQSVMESTTSTAMVSSFGRNQSGNYTCTTIVSSTSSFLTNSMASSSTRVTVGVYLSLKGMIYPNNSIISITEIEETNDTSNNGLQCITDLNPCCAATDPVNRLGSWMFPDNEGIVPPIVRATTFYLNRSHDGTVNLNRVNTDVMMPTGMFCCVVPDATGVNQTVCAIIVSVTIATIGSPTAGENYTLKCSVNGTSDPATYQWFGPPNGESSTNSSSRMVFSNSSLSLLEFSPLQTSHAGVYTCRATVNDVVMVENTINVNVNVPAPTVTVSSDPVSPIRPVGSNVTLTCIVALSPAVDVPVTVTTVWTGPAGFMTTNTTYLDMGSTTNFACTSTAMVGSVGRGQSGVYTCTATVNSTFSFLTNIMASSSTRVTVGVYLSLKGVIYPNNSVISITEIDQTSTTSNKGLQCITDRMLCCVQPTRQGEWFFPDDGGMVLSVGSVVTTFYRNRYDDGTVNLNRLNTYVMMPTGMFCCVVPDATDVDQTVCATIASITLTANTADSPTAGSLYTLECSTSVSMPSDQASYEWTKNNGTQTQVGSNSNTLSFSSLSLSDAGRYTCAVLQGNINATAFKNVRIQIPAPTNVTVTPPSGEIIAGSSPSLTCTVTLSRAVDVPVNVTTTWTVPEGVIVSSSQLVSMDLMRHTIFTAARNGSYTCQATVSSSSQFTTGSNTASGAFNVEVEPLPIPTNLVVTQSLATSISLSWKQPFGADAVNSYQINYNYTINECSGDNLSQGSRNVGNVTSFNLTNSSQTPVEEDCTYSITVTAINEVINSTSSAIMAITSAAAPSGAPQNLRAIFINATSITLQWEEVTCQHRNGMIDDYLISYSGKNVTVFSGKTFTANRLLPRKQYTFSTNAFSSDFGPGPNVTITNETSVLQEVSCVLKNAIYGNNSIVSVEDIAENDEALLCYTNSIECCENRQQVGSDYTNSRQWYFPNGTTVNTSGDGSVFYRDSGPSVVRLNRRNNAMTPTGVFRCEIPDASGINQSIYVGIYPLREGVPTISDSLSYSYGRNQSLKCTSIGGPATSVVWLKNGQVLGAEFDQHKQIINEERSKYQNVIMLGQQSPEDIIGNYICLVKNSRGENTRSILLFGLQTTMLEEATIIPLDSSLSINCTTDLAVTSLEWLDSDNNMLMNTSEEYLVLVIDSITEDHDKLEYTCRVISPFGNQTKSVTLFVAQPAPNNSVAGIAGGIVTALIIVALVLVLILVLFIAKRSQRWKLFRTPIQFKPRYVTHKHDSPDHDYVKAPPTSHENEGERLELRERDETVEDGDKEYYFMDTTLIAGEREKAVTVSEFSSHVERLHADRDKLFEMEYENVSKTPQLSYSIAEIPHNKLKNRFANIFPYDISRVKLKEIAGEDGSDYINASYLNGYKKPKGYIGAQGPMPNTVSDFWRLIWERKLPTVVMLTRCFEGRKKCEEYWPVNVGESVHPGHDITVTLTSILPFAEYSVRKMTVTCSSARGSAPLKVTQFHFTGWPDHGVPQNGIVLINFIRRVRTGHPYSDSRPLLVHCSAGVGRTGAFIVLDSMLQRMKIEENLNIFEFLKQLRAQRVLMVQTQSQYNFIHDALNELILCGDTETTAPNLRLVMSRLSKNKDGETGYFRQFSLIDQMSPPASESDYSQAKMECNVSKNRYPDILPNDHFRVLLRSTAVPGSDYINASFIDGYSQRGAYIATQTPMENTVNDFWKMIWDYQSRSIVMLCRMKEDGKEACHSFLPDSKGVSDVYGKITVKMVSQDISTDYAIIHVEISEDKPHPQSPTPSAEETRSVTVCHYLRWPKHGCPRGTTGLLELTDYINKSQMSSGNKPITVMCNNGVGRTGTFVCIHAQLERLKTEGVVDFFQSIKSARIQRAGLVPDVHQYIFCHTVLADYLDGFDTYANFKELV